MQLRPKFSVTKKCYQIVYCVNAFLVTLTIVLFSDDLFGYIPGISSQSCNQGTLQGQVNKSKNNSNAGLYRLS